MPTQADLNRLLSAVRFDARLNVVEGIDPFRNLLQKDSNAQVRRFLEAALGKVTGRERGGIAFVLAEHYRIKGNLQALRELFAIDDPAVRESTLNASWGEPGDNPEMGPGIISLAVKGASDPSPEVRAQSCSVIQNQCGWGVDVGPTVATLLDLLADPHPNVRRMAAFATGNVGKRRFDWAPHLAALRRLLTDKDVHVPGAAAWALAKMSRSRIDIGPAVPELVGVLCQGGEYDKPRSEAAGALVHHARKSSEARDQVRQALTAASLDERKKEIKRFLKQLADL